MQTNLINPRPFHLSYPKTYCVLMFLIIFIPLFIIALSLNNLNHPAFQVALLFTGWFAWTFFEYMTHRYLMHASGKEKQLVDFNHVYHHTHPTEIKITVIQRSLLLFACLIVIGISIWLDNYFTLVAGFLCGFPIYTLMHFLLHQKMMQKFLGKVIRYHIYHHCKYSDKCFGVCVTWWDDIIGTGPPANAVISQRIIDFYFRHEDKEREKNHPGDIVEVGALSPPPIYLSVFHK